MSGHVVQDVVGPDVWRNLCFEFKDFCQSIEDIRDRVRNIKQRIVRSENRLSRFDNTALKPKEDWTTFFAISSDDTTWRPMKQCFGPYRSNLEEEDGPAVEAVLACVRQDTNDPVDEVVRRLAMEGLPSVGLLSLQFSKYSLTYNSSTLFPKCVPQEAFGSEVSKVKKRLLDLEKQLQSALTSEWIQCALLPKLVAVASLKSEVARNEAYALGAELLDVVLEKVVPATGGRRRPHDHDYFGDDVVVAKRQRVIDQKSNEDDSNMIYLQVTNVPTQLFNVKHFALHFKSNLATFELNGDTLTVGFVNDEKALKECKEFVEEPYSSPWLKKLVQARVTRCKDDVFEHVKKHSEGFNELANRLLKLESDYDDNSDGDDSENDSEEEEGNSQGVLESLVDDLLDFEKLSWQESLEGFELLAGIVIPFWKRISFTYRARWLYDDLKRAWHKFLLAATLRNLIDVGVLEASVASVFDSANEFQESLHGWEDPTIVQVMSSEDVVISEAPQSESELNKLRVQALEKANEMNFALRLASFYGLESDQLRILLQLKMHEEAFSRFFRDKNASESDRIKFYSQVVFDHDLDIFTRFRFLMHSAFELLKRWRLHIEEDQLHPGDCFLSLLAEALATDSRCLPWIFANLDCFGSGILDALQNANRDHCIQLFGHKSSSPESVLACTCLIIVDSRTTYDQNVFEMCDRVGCDKPLVAALVLILRLRAANNENKMELQSRLWQVIMTSSDAILESDFHMVWGEALRLLPSVCSLHCQLLSDVILPEAWRLPEHFQAQLKLATVSNLVRRFRAEGFCAASHKAVVDCIRSLEQTIPQAKKAYLAALLGVLAETHSEMPRELLERVSSEPSLREEMIEMLLANIKLSLCLDHVDLFLEHCKEGQISDLLEFFEACPQDAVDSFEKIINAGSVKRYPGLKARFFSCWNVVFGSSKRNWARLLGLAMSHFTEESMSPAVLRSRVCEALKSPECRSKDKVFMLRLLHDNSEKFSFASEVCASGSECLVRGSPELYLAPIMEWADEDISRLLAKVIMEKVHFDEHGLDIAIVKRFFDVCAEKFPSVLHSKSGLLLSLFKKDILVYCDLLLNHGDSAEIEDSCRHLVNVMAKRPSDVIEKVLQKLFQSGKVDDSRLNTISTEYVETVSKPAAALVILILDWLKDRSHYIAAFLGAVKDKMLNEGTSISCQQFVRPVCRFLHGLCQSRADLKPTINTFFGSVIRLLRAALDKANSSVSVVTWKRDVSTLTKCILGCTGCQKLFAFLESPTRNSENIVVNGQCRKCINRVLNSYLIERSTGRQVRASERLSLVSHERTAKENPGNCGSVHVTKKEVPDAAKASFIRECQITIQLLSRMCAELSSASGNLVILE